MSSDPLGLIRGTSASGLSPIKPMAGQAAGSDQVTSFKDVLMKNINEVNRLQQDAQTAIEDLASGKRDDITSVMLAKQKADMAFQMLVQVRNKMMSAYEEIKQMRV